MSDLNHWLQRQETFRTRLTEITGLPQDQRRRRADLRRGVVSWFSEGGGVLARARARILCTLNRSKRTLTAGWSLPASHQVVAVEAVPGLPTEQHLDHLDDATAIAVQIAAFHDVDYLDRFDDHDVSIFVGVDQLQAGDGGAVADPAFPRPWLMAQITPLALALERGDPGRDYAHKVAQTAANVRRVADHDLSVEADIRRMHDVARLMELSAAALEGLEERPEKRTLMLTTAEHALRAAYSIIADPPPPSGQT